METIWIAVLNISPRTAEKLRVDHRLEPDDLRLALVAVRGLPFRWHEHPERGRRAIVRVRIRRSDVLCVLYQAADPMGDAWNLGSAYRVT